MQKRFFYVLIMFGFSLCSLAQKPVKEEVQKLKIKKISSMIQSDNSTNGKIEWHYNSYGDDTAMYYNGQRSWYKTIVYDKVQRITTIKKYSNDGVEKESTIYTYKPDGSFISESIDKEYGMKNTVVYDNTGKEKTHTIPDGSVRFSEYNSKGQLVKYYAVPKNGGIELTNTYLYNDKGKLISLEKKGDYKSSTAYEYDTMGLLKKETITTINEDDEKTVSVYLYTYAY